MSVKCIQCKMEVHNSTFASNNGVYGGAIYAMNSTILLLYSTFINNGKLAESKSYGGVLNGNQINLIVIDCAFNGNGQQFNFLGGVLNCLQSNIEVRGSCFIVNKAQSEGAFFTGKSNVTIYNSYFEGNKGGTYNYYGGVLQTYNSVIRIMSTTFSRNSISGTGAVLFASNSTVYIESSFFMYNTAQTGGVLCIWENSILLMSGTNTFINNTASRYGSNIHVYNGTMKGSGTVLVQNGNALLESVAFISSLGHFNGTFSLLNNTGSLFVFDSSLRIMRNITISRNSPATNGTQTNILEGGGITTFLSTITLEGVINISRNCAINGGGILASASKVDLFGNISFFKNAASDTGGAIYLQQSEVNIKGYAFLKENSANSKGGAIHAVRSYVSLTLIRKLPFSSSHLYLISNSANKGGGIYFEVYSKRQQRK